ncbi:MAG: hypothetical protein ACXVPN_16435 [Bacteroidia bacterium]
MRHYSMPNFVIIENEATGDIYIEEDSQYNHLNADTVIVAENVHVRLFGTIHKLLVINKGAVVQLHGSVKGKLENHGEVHIH